MTTDANNSITAMLQNGQFITAPGVFDLVSAKIADRTDAQAIYMTGYGVVASYLGQPDAGLATYTDMVNRAEAIVDAIHKPLIADGDTGYGGLLNVAHTVRGYEKAGVAVIQIEDQHFPKKCGHTPNRHVVPTQEMVNKIKVASDARSSADFLILARTDALTSLGLDEALRRGEAYANAGADILFIEAPESKEQMRKIGAAFDVRADIDEIVTCTDGRLLAVGTYRGTHRGDGHAVDARFMHLWTIADGRARALEQVTDTARW